MKIVISGVGEVGSHLAKMLSSEYHDITIIDNDPKRLEEIANMADVIAVEGDCTTFAVLKKAAVRKADLFIAVRPEESTNIISAVLAKQLGAKKAIARIDNNEYLEPNNKEMFINMGIDYLFYPEKAAAREVINLLGHTSTNEYVDFSGGKLSLVVFKLDITSPLVNKSLLEITEDRENLPYRTVAISRGNETIIPRGNDVFKEGDNIYVISNQDAIKDVMDLSGKKNIDINNVMILGGSRIGIQIASVLQNEVNIKLVEYNPEKATALLREAGWEMNPQTGILEKDGKPFVLTFLSNGASQEKFLARFRTALRQAGIILQSERKDWAGWARDMDVYQFDISWCAWSSGLRKDPEGMWSGKQINEPGGNNITGFSDARVDELITAQRTLFDLSARNEICREIDRILTEQVPYILLWNTDRTNLLWWNKFGVPPSILSRFGDASDAIALWWHDADAADALRDAMETGAALPDAF